jgi:hypothetical protein
VVLRKKKKCQTVDPSEIDWSLTSPPAINNHYFIVLHAQLGAHLKEQISILVHPEVPRVAPAALLAHDDGQALVQQHAALAPLAHLSLATLQQNAPLIFRRYLAISATANAFISP